MSGKAAIGTVRENLLVKDGKALVSRIRADRNSLKERILEAVDSVGGFARVVEKSDQVLLKPNFNTADAPPGRVILILSRLS